MLHNGFILYQNRYVDDKLKKSKGFKYQKILEHFPQAKERLGFWTPELCATRPKMFDFIVTVSSIGREMIHLLNVYVAWR